MIAVTHLMGDGFARVDVTICWACERGDPDFKRLRGQGAYPFYFGVSHGARAVERCEHPDHGKGGAS